MDDFWGEAAWAHWTRELAKAMPPPEYTIEDVPLTDPIFHSQIEVKRIPQVSGIGFWRATGGRVDLRAWRGNRGGALPRRSATATAASSP